MPRGITKRKTLFCCNQRRKDTTSRHNHKTIKQLSAVIIAAQRMNYPIICALLKSKTSRKVLIISIFVLIFEVILYFSPY